MAQEQTQEESQSPSPATGLRRRWNQLALFSLHALPAPMRRRLGWWRWSEVAGREYGDAMSLVRRSSLRRLEKGMSATIPTPVHDLFRRGLLPAPDADLFPARFTDFHQAWETTHWMELPDKEFEAWVAVCKSHPAGKGFLENLLVDLVRQEDVDPDQVRRVIAAGANPSRAKDLVGAIFMEKPRPMETVLPIWAEVCRSTHPIPTWEEWAAQKPAPSALKRTSHEMQQWKESGLPMPTGKASLLHALAWTREPVLFFNDDKDPDFDRFQSGDLGKGLFQDTSVSLQAIGWFKEHGAMPPGSDTALLAAWLSRANIKEHKESHQAASAWLEELCSAGLPPRPSRGPDWSHTQGSPPAGPGELAMPWSHWMARCAHFENVPSRYREALFSEPDAWTARNRWGEDAFALYGRRMADLEKGQEGIGLASMRAFLDSHAMDRELSLAPESVPLPEATSPSLKSRF